MGAELEVASDIGPQRPLLPAAESTIVVVGKLEMEKKASGYTAVRWDEKHVDLTLSEGSVVDFLVSRTVRGCSYLELQELMRGKGFHIGNGEEGTRTNIRSMMKRIRSRFKEVDPDFNEIENLWAFGYRWRPTTY